MDLLILMDNIKNNTNNKKNKDKKNESKKNIDKKDIKREYKYKKYIDGDNWEKTTYGTYLYRKKENDNKIDILEDTMWWCEDY